MEASTQKRLSLDTNVLFDLAEEQDFAHYFGGSPEPVDEFQLFSDSRHHED